jgi:hypothetical protein
MLSHSSNRDETEPVRRSALRSALTQIALAAAALPLVNVLPGSAAEKPKLAQNQSPRRGLTVARFRPA